MRRLYGFTKQEQVVNINSETLNIHYLKQVCKIFLDDRLGRLTSFSSSYSHDRDELLENTYEQILQAVAELVQYALETAILGAQSALGSRAEEYILGLKVNDDLTIGISEDAAHLEHGYPSYEMLPELATGSKSKTAEDGSQYTVIPLGRSKGSNIQAAISMKASELLKSGWMSSSQTSAMQMAETMKISKTSTPSKEPHGFATASTKQDPSKSWVNPGFAGVKQLSFINQQLKADIKDKVISLAENAARSWYD